MKKIIIVVVAILCIGVGFALLITKTVPFPGRGQETEPAATIAADETVPADATALTDESGSAIDGQSKAEGSTDENGEATEEGKTTKKSVATKKNETTKKERTTRAVTTRSPDATTRKGAYGYAQTPDVLTATTAAAATEASFTMPTTAALSAKDHPYTFASQADFDRNFAAYGSDFGDVTPDQYLTYANSLIISTTPYVEKKYVGGITHFYNPPTGEYASVSDDGHIIMYNRPKDPDKFWANIGS